MEGQGIGGFRVIWGLGLGVRVRARIKARYK